VNDAVSVLASQETPMPIPQELLALDARERVAAFRSGGKNYRHIFRRLTALDWEKFFSHVVAEFKQEKDGYSQVVDTDYASLMLYNRAIVRVEGYKTVNGVPPNELPSWPECIPQHHRLAAAGILMNVTQSEGGDESMLEAEGVSVLLDAMWNEGETGAMKQYRGLVHKFASPTAEHRRRFLKSKNRSFIAGGSRTGTTLIPSAHPVLVAIYDELIQRVEGYGIGGREMASRDEIVREMDAFHKSSALSRLFKFSGEIETKSE
jgi:hypothetical protein